MIFVLFFTDTTFTAVTADILAAAGEFVDGQTAVVGTSTAVCHCGCVFQFIDLVNGEHGGFLTLLVTFAGDQGSAERTHDSGDIRTDGFTVGDFFKASQNCIIIESTALYNDVLTKFGSIGNLDNFIKRILDNGVSKTCGNIGNFSAFFLRLLYL